MKIRSVIIMLGLGGGPHSPDGFENLMETTLLKETSLLKIS